MKNLLEVTCGKFKTINFYTGKMHIIFYLLNLICVHLLYVFPFRRDLFIIFTKN